MLHHRFFNTLAVLLASPLWFGLGAHAGEDWEGDSLPAENCDVPDYAYTVGGGSDSEGAAFCASKFKEGVMIKTIEVQGDKHSLRGIRITYTDQDSREFGRKIDETSTDRSGAIEIDPLGDSIVRMEMWENGYVSPKRSDAVGALLIKTSSGQSLDVEHDWANDDVRMKLDVSEGRMLLGIRGRHGDAIDQLEFIFSKSRALKASVEDVVLKTQLDELPLEDSEEAGSPEIERLDELYHLNSMNKNMDIRFSGSKTLEEKTEFSMSHAYSWTKKITVSVKQKLKLFEIGETEVGVEGEIGDTTEDREGSSNSTSEAVTRTWMLIPTVEPHSAMRCLAFTYKATITKIAWEGNTRVHFSDGSSLVYPSFGDYSVTRYDRVYSKCEEACYEDALAFFNNGGKVLEDGKPLSTRRRSIGARRAIESRSKCKMDMGDMGNVGNLGIKAPNFNSTQV